jgi:hypothetical protein
LGGLGEGLLLGGLGEQAGDEAVGELSEGLVNLGLKEGEGGGVAVQLFGPGLLVGGELLLDLLQGEGGCRDVRPGLGVEAEAHGEVLSRQDTGPPLE